MVDSVRGSYYIIDTSRSLFLLVQVCSLWRVYSGIVLSYLDGTVSAEHRYAHEMYSSSSRQHRHQQSHTKVSSDDVGIDIPNQSVCCQHTREVAEDFLGVSMRSSAYTHFIFIDDR